VRLATNTAHCDIIKIIPNFLKRLTSILSQTRPTVRTAALSAKATCNYHRPDRLSAKARVIITDQTDCQTRPTALSPKARVISLDDLKVLNITKG
jgi:hypothetical protein